MPSSQSVEERKRGGRRGFSVSKKREGKRGEEKIPKPPSKKCSFTRINYRRGKPSIESLSTRKGKKKLMGLLYISIAGREEGGQEQGNPLAFILRRATSDADRGKKAAMT